MVLRRYSEIKLIEKRRQKKLLHRYLMQNFKIRKTWPSEAFHNAYLGSRDGKQYGMSKKTKVSKDCLASQV